MDALTIKTTGTRLIRPVVVLCLFLFVLIVNLPLGVDLWQFSFDDGTYSHAYLIPAIMFYVLYVQNASGLIRFRSRISWPWLSAALCGSYILWALVNAQLALGVRTVFPLLMAVFVLCIVEANRPTLMCMVLLIFMAPVWNILNPVLQHISVFSVRYIISFTEIPFLIEGNYITVPAGTFEVASGCSGLRYLLVSLAMWVVSIAITQINKRRSILLLVLLILGALLTNWIRISLLVVIGQETNMQSPLMTDHNDFGWYIYLPVLFMYLISLNKLSTHLPVKTTNQAPDYPSRVVTISSMIILLPFASVWPLILSPYSMAQSLSIPSLNHVAGLSHQPRFYGASEVIDQGTDAENQQLKYLYAGDTIHKKPAYYLNSPIPEGFKVQVKHQFPDKTRYIAVDSLGDQYVISTSYQLGGKNYADGSSYKLAKLIHGLYGEKSLSVVWTLQKCNKVCDKENQ